MNIMTLPRETPNQLKLTNFKLESMWLTVKHPKRSFTFTLKDNAYWKTWVDLYIGTSLPPIEFEFLTYYVGWSKSLF